MAGYQEAIHPDDATRECPTGTLLCRDPDGDQTVTGRVENYICIVNQQGLSQNDLLKNCPITSISIDYIKNTKQGVGEPTWTVSTSSISTSKQGGS